MDTSRARVIAWAVGLLTLVLIAACQRPDAAAAVQAPRLQPPASRRPGDALDATFQAAGNRTIGPLALQQGTLQYEIVISPSTTVTDRYQIVLRTDSGDAVNAIDGNPPRIIVLPDGTRSTSQTGSVLRTMQVPSPGLYEIDVQMPRGEQWSLGTTQPPRIGPPATPTAIPTRVPSTAPRTPVPTATATMQIRSSIDPRLMVFSVADLPPGYELNPADSGYIDNQQAAQSNPELLEQYERHGREIGYVVNFRPARGAGVLRLLIIRHVVSVYKTPEGARQVLEWWSDNQPQEVQRFPVPPLGDEAIGMTAEVSVPVNAPLPGKEAAITFVDTNISILKGRMLISVITSSLKGLEAPEKTIELAQKAAALEPGPIRQP